MKRKSDNALVEFCYTEGRRDVPIPVRVEGRVTGEIRPVEGGWQYFPKGRKEGGEIFKTAGDVQRSLCEDEPTPTAPGEKP